MKYAEQIEAHLLHLAETGITGKVNKHMTHIEDLVILAGAEGVEHALDTFNALYDELKGETPKSQRRVSVKIDGAPAVFIWTSFPGLEGPGIATKGLFAKTPKAAYNHELIDQYFGHAPDLAKKMHAMFDYIPQFGIPEGQIWQGDFLYDSGSLSSQDIDGEPYIVFHPNTIVYAVPQNSEIGRRIQQTDVGVVWHTVYTGDSVESVTPSFTAKAESLNHVEGVFSTDPYVKSIAGEVTMTAEETAAMDQKLVEAEALAQQLISHPQYEVVVNDEAFISSFFTVFQNATIKGGKKVPDADTFIIDFTTWAVDKITVAAERKIAGLKTEKGQVAARQKMEQDLQTVQEMIERNEDVLVLIIRLISLFTQIKEIFTRKMDALGGFQAYLQMKSGEFRRTGQEGFAISDISGNVVKFVDRTEFSFANFSADVKKGWENTRVQESTTHLQESAASDAYERAIAKAITAGPSDVIAERPSVSTKYPDILMHRPGYEDQWLEVKMNHSDQLGTPRVYFESGEWKTTYTTPLAQFAVDLLNEDPDAAQFIEDISAYVGIPADEILIPTTATPLSLPNAVSRDEMSAFLSQRGGNYIVTKPDVDLGDLVTRHYTQGKAVPTHYLQAGDDFYLIGNSDPWNLQEATELEIPTFRGTGPFRMRIGVRTRYYEVLSEIKIADGMEDSPYSLRPGSQKPSPFYNISSLRESKKKANTLPQQLDALMERLTEEAIAELSSEAFQALLKQLSDIEKAGQVTKRQVNTLAHYIDDIFPQIDPELIQMKIISSSAAAKKRAAAIYNRHRKAPVVYNRLLHNMGRFQDELLPLAMTAWRAIDINLINKFADLLETSPLITAEEIRAAHRKPVAWAPIVHQKLSSASQFSEDDIDLLLEALEQTYRVTAKGAASMGDGETLYAILARSEKPERGDLKVPGYGELEVKGAMGRLKGLNAPVSGPTRAHTKMLGVAKQYPKVLEVLKDPRIRAVSEPSKSSDMLSFKLTMLTNLYPAVYQALETEKQRYEFFEKLLTAYIETIHSSAQSMFTVGSEQQRLLDYAIDSFAQADFLVGAKVIAALQFSIYRKADNFTGILSVNPDKFLLIETPEDLLNVGYIGQADKTSNSYIQIKPSSVGTDEPGAAAGITLEA